MLALSTLDMLCSCVQYTVGAELQEKSQEGVFKAYKSLRAAHLDHIFSLQDVVLAKNMIGGRLSHYTYVREDSLIPATMQTVLCRIQYFKVKDNQSDNEAVAVVTREPSHHFGIEEFEVEAHKLSSKADEQERKMADLEAAVDFTVEVFFGATERVAKSSRPMHVTAGTALPHAEVKVFNKVPIRGTQR